MKHISLIAIASLTVLPLAELERAQMLSSGPDSRARLEMAADGADPSTTQPTAESKPAAAALGAADKGKQVKVAITPYAWLTSLNGDVTARGIDIDLDLSFTAIFNAWDSLFTLMGQVDVGYDRRIFQFNGAHASLNFQGSRGVHKNGIVTANTGQTLGWYEFCGGYRVLDQPMEANAARRLTLDGVVGGRPTDISIDATVSASSTITLPGGEVINVGQTRERSASVDWFEPFEGAHLGVDLSENWVLLPRADVGGFGLDGAGLAWQAIGGAGHRWKTDGWTLTAYVGHRALSQDCPDGDFARNAITHGPMIGAQFAKVF